MRISLANGGFTVIDEADVGLVAGRTWRRSRNGYAVASTKVAGRTRKLYMHRVIMCAPEHLDVDHINHDQLDNRRSNLRLCTRAENTRHQLKSRGSSRYKGVCWDRFTGSWKVSIGFRGRVRHLGRFRDEAAAGRAYDVAAAELFGPFACLNFPEEAVA